MNHSEQVISVRLRQLIEALYAIEKGDYRSGMLVDLLSQQDEIGQLARMLDSVAREMLFKEKQRQLLRTVIPIGVLLSAEKDFDQLLETIVLKSQEITNADAGTLYLVEEGRRLRFMIVRNVSLGLATGGTSGNPVTFQPIPLYKPDGEENRANVASYVALTGERVNIPDAYQAEGFDFTGTKLFDQRTGYRSKSFFAFPLENQSGEIIGVLQLINSKDPENGEIIAFQPDDVLESLVMLACAALDGYIREQRLHQEIAKLRIEIDETRRAHQVAEITETDYFKSLQGKASEMRRKASKQDEK
jgi:GAF domain-containing protein